MPEHALPRREARGIRLVLEASMYLAFFAAALPSAWFGTNELLYYHAYPERLESRDSAPLVFAAMAAIQIMEYALAAAGLLALFFLVKGPRAVRYSIAAVVTGWILVFLGLMFAPPTPFASMARLWLDAIPFVALSLLPLACASVRWALRKPREVSNHDNHA